MVKIHCVESYGLDSIDPIDERGDEAKTCEVIASGFVVTGGNGPKIFQPAEGSLDDVSQAIKSGVEWEALLAVDFVRDGRRRAASLQEETQMIRVIAFVANKPLARRRGGEQRGSALDVGDLSARQQEGVRSTLLVDERMDFCRAPAARTADGLILRPPFLAPLAERCALTAELSPRISVAKDRVGSNDYIG